MDKYIYQISGRVKQCDKHTGVRGLCVEIWDHGHYENRCLGRGVTMEDGSFNIAIQNRNINESYELKSKLYLSIINPTSK
jgi:hypothetical protein